MPLQAQEQETLNVKLVHFTKQNSPDEPVRRALRQEGGDPPRLLSEQVRPVQVPLHQLHKFWIADNTRFQLMLRFGDEIKLVNRIDTLPRFGIRVLDAYPACYS